MATDWVCTMHGKKMSEHVCLYCCICFKDLTEETCRVLPDGSKEDVCNECADKEEQVIRSGLRGSQL